MSHPPFSASSALQTPSAPDAADDALTVLVVDDAEAELETLQELLEPLANVLTARNGTEGLERARLYVPDLVVLDLYLPDMTGFELLRRLKADVRTEQVPVLFLVGQGQADDRMRCLSLGAADYIGKPLNAPVVEARATAQLRLARYRRQVDELSFLDGLTGVTNRRRFDEALVKESHRAQRSMTQLSVAVVDLDHFKAFNERYGHARGDDALVAVADLLRRSIRRPADLVARHGGEEFVLIMPDTGAASALRLTRALCAGVAALAIPHAASPTASQLTVSIGVATTEVGEDGDGDAVLARALENLARAKAAGRNRAIGQVD